MKTIALLITTLALSATAFAQTSPLSYSYIEAGYGVGEVEDEDLSAFGLSASAAITENLFLKGSYVNGSTDDEFLGIDEIDVTSYDVGLGFHMPIANTTDFVAAISYSSLEAEFGNFSEEGNGYGVEAGFRFKLTQQFEVNTFINYSDIENEDDTGFSASAYYFVTPTFSLGLGYSGADDVDLYSLSGRVHF